ncbi:hypothetical protein PTSG_03458 [Salpingoeca rosetta]|uniref:Uncharacterized protein n=1 Tax=Salpingoeca rosetta (strain ATCC 50818 / BSB-021) TaxID=946362 RepID=F2U593_SALR5|nr:uncharacterized protein PTSG_03458 [Salpingoeca rosetta]EGD82809.1 hypothetical protein PTSG_03458 [Salpingoeca rosetta]|eukprot:XP_004996044.1 hypothetical protein PTSG_03458 [Salpingoeca rosetta]
MADTNGKPSPLRLEEVVFDIDFHPTTSLLATGLITGEVSLYEYSADGHEEHPMESQHESSCRAVLFSHDGRSLFTASSDASLQVIDVVSGTVVHRREQSHKHPINCLTLLSNGVLASGDDNGGIRLWDRRTREMVQSYNAHEQFVSNMTSIDNTLLAAGGDGRLSARDISAKTTKTSDQVEYGLTCLSVVHGGAKVLCGAENGSMPMYTTGRWGDMSDRVVGHPTDVSVDAMISVDDDAVLIGSLDGGVRVVSVFPNRVVARIGSHKDAVEAFAMSYDRKWVASCAQDKTVRFWDRSKVVAKREEVFATNDDDDDEHKVEADNADEAVGGGDDSGDGDGDGDDGAEQEGAKVTSAGNDQGNDDNNDDDNDKDDDDDDNDDDDDDDLLAIEHQQLRPKKKSKSSKPKTRAFFDDL